MKMGNKKIIFLIGFFMGIFLLAGCREEKQAELLGESDTEKYLTEKKKTEIADADSTGREKTPIESEQDMLAYEISRRYENTVDAIINSQEGYEEFIRVLPEFQDCSVLRMDLKGKDTSLYMDEILAYRNFDYLYIDNGGNIRTKDIENFHNDTLVHISLNNITGMEEGILSRITNREYVHICTDSRYRGTFPVQEILNDTVSESLTVITERDIGLMDMEGADTKDIKEWEYFKDIPEKEGRYLGRIYRVNTGEYCYTGYEFCEPDIQDDRPHVFLCVKDKASVGEVFLEILEFPEEGLPPMSPMDGTRIFLEDVNFDGYQDIIYMGGNNGWELYRQNVGILWNEEKKQYEIEESFPEYVRLIDAERKRLTWITVSGNYEKYYIYEYADGVYEEKRLEVTYPWQSENGVVWEYYENDNLVNRMIWNHVDPKDSYCTLYDGEGTVIEERKIEGENWYYSGIGQLFFPEFDFYYNG